MVGVSPEHKTNSSNASEGLRNDDVIWFGVEAMEDEGSRVGAEVA